MSGSKFDSRVARLRREMAPRVEPLQLGPAEKPERVPQAKRVALCEQLRAQLLFGDEPGPFPSLAFHPRAAEFYRLRAIGSKIFQRLEAAIAEDPATGARLFGEDWPLVAHVFAVGKAPKRKREPLEEVDVAAHRAEQWRAYLASPEGRSAVERGLIVFGGAVLGASNTSTQGSSLSKEAP